MVEIEEIRGFGDAIKKNIQCPICLGILKCPTSGECLHKFCKVCIEQQITIRRKPRCPICNNPISKRSLRKADELKSVLKNAELILNNLNEDGSLEADEEPIVIFSQINISASDSPVKVHAPDTAVTVHTDPVTVSDTPCIPTKTPIIAKPKMVVKTPARKWKSNDCASSNSRKRKKTNESHQNQIDNIEEKHLLFEALEKSNLGERKQSNCKRKETIARLSSDDVQINQNDIIKKSVTNDNDPKDMKVKSISLANNNLGENSKSLAQLISKQPSTSGEEKENKANRINKSAEESAVTNILDYKVAIAARTRAIERLQQQTREFESNGKVTHPSFNSTSYDSPKPTAALSKKVSPFVLKPINKDTPSPDLRIIENPVKTDSKNQTIPKDKTTDYKDDRPVHVHVNSEEDDSLDISIKTRATSKTLDVSSSDSESSEITPDSTKKSREVKTSNSSDKSAFSLTRRSLRRKAVKPPIIDDDDEENLGVSDFNILLDNPLELNTVDVLETSMGLKDQSGSFKDGISIQNKSAKTYPSERSDIIKIGNTKRKYLRSQDKEIPVSTHECIEDSSKSKEFNDTDDLPLCGIEQELAKFSENRPTKDMTSVSTVGSPIYDSCVPVPNVYSEPKKSVLSRVRSKKCPTTPEPTKLIANSSFSAVTPSQIAIKSTNTVLETPLLTKREIFKVLETPRALNNSESYKVNDSRKRSINFEESDDDKSQGSKDKKIKYIIDNTDSINSKISPIGEFTDITRGPSKPPTTTLKGFVNKCMDDGNPKVSSSKSSVVPINRKHRVAEVVFNETDAKTSPKLTIDKNGDQINYTIEKDNPVAKLTIIQEGQMLSPKLMKHIYDDVLNSAPNSCAELINSLIEDNEISLKSDSKEHFVCQNTEENKASEQYDQQNSLNVDHTALIFGVDSHSSVCSGSKAEGAKSDTMQTVVYELDSLEGYTYQPTDFNEVEFKKTFGISTDSSVLQNDPNNTSPSKKDGSEVSLINFQANIVEDSQPDCLENKLSGIKKIIDSQHPSAENLNKDEIFDTVPEINDVTSIDCYSSEERETPFKHPFTSSTQHTKISTPASQNTPTTPDGTIVSSNGQTYTTQDIAQIQKQIRANEMELLKLQEVNEDVCTPDELFSDNDADITVCEDKGVVCEVKDTFIDALFEGNCSLHQSKDTLCDDLIPDNSISKEIPDDSSPSNITKPGNKTFSANAVSQNSGSDSLTGEKRKLELPTPDFSSSAVSNDLPATQGEQSPVIVCRTPSVTTLIEPSPSIIYILLSGMIGRSRSKYALRLQHCLRDSCGVRFKLLTQYSDLVTHLIFPHNEEMLCPQTTKYLQGLAGGKWIVSNEWLKQCVLRKELTSEAPYEMQGCPAHGRTGSPRAARLAKTLKQPPLFSNLTVYFVGDIQIMPIPVFSQLIESLGANILPSGGQTHLSYKTQSKSCPLIDAEVTDINEATKSLGEKPLTAQWVINCLSVYRYLPNT